MRQLRSGIQLALGLLLLLTSNLAAQDAINAGSGNERSIWQAGPQKVALGDVAALDVAEGFVFANAKDTQDLLQKFGNPTSGHEMGLVSPASDDEDWLIVFEWAPVGFVKDDDKGKIDADGLLNSIRDATEAGNDERKKMGGGELHVKDWVIPPYYDSETHNLVWALEAVDESGNKVVNYNLRMLGRRGYMSATLITDPEALESNKGQIDTVLAGYSFKNGGGYADFVSGDKLAGYGLTALVVGGAGAAAAKLGLFAVLAKFIGKAWKLVVGAVVALFAAIKKLFGGRRQESEIPPPPPLPQIPNT